MTTSLILFGGPLVSGRVSWIDHDGTSTDELVRREALALHVSFGSISRDGDEPGRVEILRERFAEAARYDTAARSAADTGAPPPPFDAKLEAMRPFVRGERPVVFSAEGEPAIAAILDLAEELEIRAVVRGGRGAWKLSERLAAAEVPVIVGPVHSLPLEAHDPYDAPYANAGRLAAAGVRVAFRSHEPSLVRNLPYLAGTAVAFGLPWESAIAGLTIEPARIFGLDAEVGSLEPGKIGDVVTFRGDPLEFTTRVIHVFVGGRPVDLRDSRHLQLYERFLDRLRRAPSSARL